MENVRVKDIVRVTGGQLLCGDENKLIREFSIDSREGNEDSIFVPIIGEHVDAHKFMDKALQINGASFTSEHDSFQSEKPVIRVQDTVTAMQEVGTFYRDMLDLPIVAVTGSVGKTTTREMIATALSAEKKVYQTKGNQNSQIGVPLTLSHMSKEDQIAVLEIGMSERGQIERLTKMIRPNIAVVTMIGVSHIAQLKTQENICLEKMDIVKGLQEGGMVFLNGDDKFLAPYAGKLKKKLFFYGLGDNCDYRGDNIRTVDGKTSFDFHWQGNVMRVTLGTMGEHNVRNALAALGICHQLGLDLIAVAKALTTFHGQRQQVIKTDRCTLIDDTYNASPDSMRASVGVLDSMEGVRGRRIAALADMLELGEKEKEYHYQVGQFVGKTKVDEVVAYGDLSKEIIRGITDTTDQMKVTHFENREQMGDYLLSIVKPEDVVLLKGSNGMKLSEIAERIKKSSGDMSRPD
ncbi:MAG: UDP-N-acetylmuramoyl-tripeptide--D-alanyl-D-alanine ligase [Lachnospiraceae bacterium]|nr:UDP-N-acetylmuramoyl-tripeptide--D-alanyl-D-alanine ligase [Lachnospiraceae bacterium]